MSENIPDIATAIRCLSSLARAYKFDQIDEQLFEYDVKESLKLLRKIPVKLARIERLSKTITEDSTQ